MSSDELMKVEAGVSTEGASLSLSVGGDAPRFIEKYFPGKAARARATRLISSRILAKIAKNEPLDHADAQYANEVFGEAEAKWIRRQEVATRAVRIIEAEAATKALPAPSEDTEAKSQCTPEEWINHLWDDVGLVSDEMLQEIYARILASEVACPSSCSMRTLRALRYLDRHAAETFGLLVPLVIDDDWVPHDLALLGEFGVKFGMILELDDAGLIDSSALISKTYSGNPIYLRRHKHILRLNIPNGPAAASGIEVQCFPLRNAGKELMRVAQVTRTVDYFFRMARWLWRDRSYAEFTWAEIPDLSWSGAIDDLTWHMLPPNNK